MALECAGAALGLASVRPMANVVAVVVVVVVVFFVNVIASWRARAADPSKPAIYEYDSHCR